MRAIKLNIANLDNGGNSRAFTSNPFSLLLQLEITSDWSRKWLDRLYMIRILENKFGRGSWASHNSGAACLLH